MLPIGRTLLATSLILAAGAPATADDAELLEARKHLLKGRYAEATERYGPLAESSPAAAIGLARSLAAVGKRDQARQALDEAARRFPQSAAIAAELALSALDRGDRDAAQRHKSAALMLDKDCVPARWVEAELLKSSGKLAEAERAYAWFTSYYNRAPRIDDPETLVFIARGVAEHARWTRNRNQFRRLVSDVFPAALRLDADYWPARLEAALVYLEKYNEADAASEISAGLAINPQAAELHAARAALALGSFDLATAKSSLDRALEINPQLVWALQLRADWLFADVRPAEAIAVLEEARQLNPQDERTLGRLTAARLAVEPPGERSAEAQALLESVTKVNPHCGAFFLAAGDACDRMRRFPQAAEYYRLAGERLPQLMTPRGQLGLVLMRLGNEAEAAKLLEESFAIDPFNVRVKNQLEVLDLLKNYAVVETDHFVLKFDRGQNDLLATYAARHLEETFADLTDRLGHVPKDKTLVEIFSRHGSESGQNWFSARMVGLPLIGTVGACAGKMVALSSPTEMPKKYDWAQVLRHELVHVINLQQTDFHVPHWFTEGLAVHLEGQPRPREWTELLARRARSGSLFTLDDVTLGFVRPKSGDDWTLAYCQSELYIEHLMARFGDDAPRKMLAAYGEHLDTPEALQKLFSAAKDDFERTYREHLDRVIAAAGPAARREQATIAQLEQRIADQPNDAESLAELARSWLDRDDKPQARRYALAAQKAKPRHALAAYVLARLQLSIGDREAAVQLLEPALDRQSPQEDLLALLAALRLQAGDASAAQSLYELGDAKLPHSDRWLRGLVKIHLQAGDNARLLPVLKRLVEQEPDNVAARQKLAELAQDAKDYSQVAALAMRGIHADVEDAASHYLLAVALAGQAKHAPAVEEYQVALRLDGNQADWLAGLATSQLALEMKDLARDTIERLRKAQRDHPQLPELEKKLLP
ncbi:MAG: tetratricopeptide repeat protein [Planctomycetaceae bacterium]|nr:tetratricopeptide repeat protein [Planctomycetaceae bacterium]